MHPIPFISISGINSQARAYRSRLDNFSFAGNRSRADRRSLGQICQRSLFTTLCKYKALTLVPGRTRFGSRVSSTSSRLRLRSRSKAAQARLVAAILNASDILVVSMVSCVGVVSEIKYEEERRVTGRLRGLVSGRRCSRVWLDVMRISSLWGSNGLSY
jgi:hypothetical protein